LKKPPVEIEKTIKMDYQRVNFASVGVTGLIRREIGEVAVSPNL
jgi:hypothetical protein